MRQVVHYESAPVHTDLASITFKLIEIIINEKLLTPNSPFITLI